MSACVILKYTHVHTVHAYIFFQRAIIRLLLGIYKEVLILLNTSVTAKQRKLVH